MQKINHKCRSASKLLDLRVVIFPLCDRKRFIFVLVEVNPEINSLGNFFFSRVTMKLMRVMVMMIFTILMVTDVVAAQSAKKKKSKTVVSGPRDTPILGPCAATPGRPHSARCACSQSR